MKHFFKPTENGRINKKLWGGVEARDCLDMLIKEGRIRDEQSRYLWTLEEIENPENKDKQYLGVE